MTVNNKAGKGEEGGQTLVLKAFSFLNNQCVLRPCFLRHGQALFADGK